MRRSSTSTPRPAVATSTQQRRALYRTPPAAVTAKTASAPESETRVVSTDFQQRIAEMKRDTNARSYRIYDNNLKEMQLLLDLPEWTEGHASNADRQLKLAKLTTSNIDRLMKAKDVIADPTLFAKTTALFQGYKLNTLLLDARLKTFNKKRQALTAVVDVTLESNAHSAQPAAGSLVTPVKAAINGEHKQNGVHSLTNDHAASEVEDIPASPITEAAIKVPALPIAAAVAHPATPNGIDTKVIAKDDDKTSMVLSTTTNAVAVVTNTAVVPAAGTSVASTAIVITEQKQVVAAVNTTEIMQIINAMQLQIVETKKESAETKKENAALKDQLDQLVNKDHHYAKQLSKYFHQDPSLKEFYNALVRELAGKFSVGLVFSADGKKIQSSDNFLGAVSLAAAGLNVVTVVGGTALAKLISWVYINHQKEKDENVVDAFSSSTSRAHEMFEKIAYQLFVSYKDVFKLLTPKGVKQVTEYAAMQLKTYLKKMGKEISTLEPQLKFEVLMKAICVTPPLPSASRFQRLSQGFEHILGLDKLELTEEGQELLGKNRVVAEFFRGPRVKYGKDIVYNGLVRQDPSKSICNWPEGAPHRTVLHSKEMDGLADGKGTMHQAEAGLNRDFPVVGSKNDHKNDQSSQPSREKSKSVTSQHAVDKPKQSPRDTSHSVGVVHKPLFGHTRRKSVVPAGVHHPDQKHGVHPAAAANGATHTHAATRPQSAKIAPAPTLTAAAPKTATPPKANDHRPIVRGARVAARMEMFKGKVINVAGKGTGTAVTGSAAKTGHHHAAPVYRKR